MFKLATLALFLTSAFAQAPANCIREILFNAGNKTGNRVAGLKLEDLRARREARPLKGYWPSVATTTQLLLSAETEMPGKGLLESEKIEDAETRLLVELTLVNRKLGIYEPITISVFKGTRQNGWTATQLESEPDDSR
jgi:hypothetical protein